MERSSEHEVVIARKLGHAGMEFAVVDKPTGLANYEERKDNPAVVSQDSVM